MEAISQRNLPELNSAVLMVEAIHFMPGDLGPRTLGIGHPWDRAPLGLRTLRTAYIWDRVHLESGTLGTACTWDRASFGSRILGMAREGQLSDKITCKRKLQNYTTSPSSWLRRFISCPGHWNEVRGLDVRHHNLLKEIVKIVEHRRSYDGRDDLFHDWGLGTDREC